MGWAGSASVGAEGAEGSELPVVPVLARVDEFHATSELPIIPYE